MTSKAALAEKDKGNEAFQKGDYARAIEHYTYATEMDPNNAVFYTNRSNCYFVMGDYEKSLRDASKSISKNPKWEKGFYRKGEALLALGRHKEAVEAFQECVNLTPANDSFQKKLLAARAALHQGMSRGQLAKEDGNAFFKAANYEAAIKAYTQAVDLCKPDETDLLADIYANRAACFAQLRDEEAAKNDCDEAIKLRPEHTKALIRRAQALEHLEKYQAALNDFTKVNQLSPGYMPSIEGANRIRQAMKNLGIPIERRE